MHKLPELRGELGRFYLLLALFSRFVLFSLILLAIAIDLDSCFALISLSICDRGNQALVWLRLCFIFGVTILLVIKLLGSVLRRYDSSPDGLVGSYGRFQCPHTQVLDLLEHAASESVAGNTAGLTDRNRGGVGLLALVSRRRLDTTRLCVMLCGLLDVGLFFTQAPLPL